MKRCERHNPSYSGSRNWMVDVYRMILILWIALFHYTSFYNTINPEIKVSYPFEFRSGCIGVPLFFMMSGYYMNTQLEKLGGAKLYFEFCAKRYYRLWLPYVISCLIIYPLLEFFPLFYGHIDFKLFLFNLLFFVHPGIRYVDGAHWFIGMLMIMQIIIGSSMIIKDKRIRINVIWYSSIMTGLCHWASMIFHFHISNPYTDSFFFILLGIQLARFIMIKDRTFMIPLSICLSYVIVRYPLLYIGGIILFVFIANIKPAIQIDKKKSWFLSTLAGISLCWYLVHSRIGCSIQYHFVPHDDTSGIWILLPVCSTLILGIIVCYLAKLLKTTLNTKYEAALSKLSEKYSN